MKTMIIGLSLLLLRDCANNGQPPWSALTNTASC